MCHSYPFIDVAKASVKYFAVLVSSEVNINTLA